MSTVFRRCASYLILPIIITILFLTGCGSKQSPTGGKEDLQKLKLLACIPEEFNEISDQKIELTFDKSVDKASFLKGIYLYPPVRSIKYNYEANVITLRFLEALEKDTNYYLTLTNRIKDVRGNALDNNQTLIFRHGILQNNRISGNIRYEKSTDEGQPIQLNLQTSDSLSVLSRTVSGKSYVLEGLNKAEYILKAYIDKNQNGRYDNMQEPYFESDVPNLPVNSVELNLVYADTLKPVIKNIRAFSNREYEIQLSKPVVKFGAVTITDVTHRKPVLINMQNHATDKIRLLTAVTDSSDLRFQITNLQDSKGNLNERSALMIQASTRPDIIPPSVVSTTPRNGAAVPDLMPVLEINFSEIIPFDRFKASLKEIETNRIVAFRIINSGSQTYKLQPEKPLSNYKTYLLTIEQETSDISGNHLKQSYKLSFLPLLRDITPARSK